MGVNMRREAIQLAGCVHQESKLSGRSCPSTGIEDEPRCRVRFGALASLRAGSKWMLGLAVLLLAGHATQAQSVFGPRGVGSKSPAQTVTVTATAAGSVSTVNVLTLGVTGLDFATGGGSSTCGSANLTVGATCTESVTFTPSVPGSRVGAVVLLDSSDKVLGTAYLSGTGTGGLGVLVNGNMITVAGVYRTWNSTQDGIPAIDANLDQPSSVVLDGSGNMYIADSVHNRIRKVTASTGLISTIAGTGAGTDKGDNGPADKATLNNPSGVAIDGAGNLYIADAGNNAIRKITSATGIIATVAGDGKPGFKGDNGAATAAELNGPLGVSIDLSGDLYIADTANQRIRKVDLATKIITTVAGDGFQSAGGFGGYKGDNGPAIEAELSLPFAVVWDPQGNMYIPDSANNVVRRVDTQGTITTYAGNNSPGLGGDGGPAIDANLHLPEGLAVDPAGNLYIADTQNSAIRKVSSKTHDISTVEISGQGETVVPGGTTPGPVVLYAPTGMVMDGYGNLFVADFYYMLIREMQSNLAILNFTAVPVRQGDLSAPQDQTVENDGNAALDLSAINHDNNAAVDQAETTCNLGTPFLAVDGDCIVAAEFAPTVAGDPLVGNVDVLGDTQNAPLDIELIGDASSVNSTTVTLISNRNPSNFGQAVKFTATVTTGAGTGNLTGTLTFFDGAKQLGVPVNLSAAGIATYTTASLAVGSHNMTAVYNGDPKHFKSTSPTLVQVVDEGTVVRLTTSQNPSQIGQSVTFTATVKGPGGSGVVPQGNVIFTDGAATLGTVTLNASGVATYSTATLANGLHTIQATYAGDPVLNILGAASNIVDQEVQAPSTNVLTSTPNPSVYGTNVVFTATIKSSGTFAPTGVVLFLDGGKVFATASPAGATGVAQFTTSTLSVGTHDITAKYEGSAEDGASTSNTVMQVVSQAATDTTVVASPNPGIAGQPVALRATVKLTQGTGVLTGTVTFTDGGVTVGTAPVAGGGRAEITRTFTAGNHIIVATYSGDTNNGGSVSPDLYLVIDRASDQVLLSVNPDPAIVDTVVNMTAVVKGDGVTPTGDVNFLADGKTIGAGHVDNTGTATFAYSQLTVGNHSITAHYDGDGFNAATTSSAKIEVVQAIPTITNLGTATVGKSQTLVASVFSTVAAGHTPTGTVTFKDGAKTIGKSALDSSGVATLTPNLPNGSYTIVAFYSGDPTHLPSESKPVVISGAAADFKLTVDPSSLSIPTKQNATVTVTLTSSGGFTDTVELGCGSVPARVTCHFSNFNISLASDTTATAQLTIDTNYPLSGGGSAMNAAPGTLKPGMRGVSLAGLLLPISGAFGLVFWRFRKRHSGLLSLELLVVVSGAAMLVTGCGGFTEMSAAPGKYVLQVNGVGANSGLQRYQNVTLTITQ